MIRGFYCKPSPQLTPEQCVSKDSCTEKGHYLCYFCKQNGEPKNRYTAHPLKDYATGIIQCPVLRSHICQICGETGDYAHTSSYCPIAKMLKSLGPELMIDDVFFCSNMGDLRRTEFSAAGKRNCYKLLEKKLFQKF